MRRRAPSSRRKRKAGTRTVPIAAVLRDFPIEQKLSTGRGEGLVFGPNGEAPANPDGLASRAAKAWKAAGTTRIGLHECRHTFASLMIATGVNAKALSTYLGHASITITLDRYGHLKWHP